MLRSRVVSFLCVGAPLTALSLFANPTAHASITLYSQPTSFPHNAYYASQNSFATDYDDFTLAQTGTITGVDWTGEFFHPPTTATIDSFTISFYGDNAGIPGTQLFTDTIPGDANAVSLGPGDNNDQPGYSYSTNLDSPFVADAGTKYWMSIAANFPLGPQWAWDSGTGGDGVSYQVFLGTGIPRTTDDAFTLIGTVPEPSPVYAMLLGALGLTSLAAIRHRTHFRARSGR